MPKRIITGEGRRLRAWASATARHRPDHPDLEVARRALKAAALERRIRDAIDGGPALDLEQRCHLARLLLPAGDA